MDKLKLLLNIMKSHQVTLEMGLAALLTAGGEQLFSGVVFKCPCNSWNLSYSAVFLLVPALALLVLGFFLRGRTWELFMGLCLRKPGAEDFKCNWAFLQEFMLLVAMASVAPVSWIAVALLNGRFYECARSGTANLTLFLADHPCSGKSQLCERELHKFPCAEYTFTVPPRDREDVLQTIHAESQVIGWLLIASIICGALLYKCVARCCSPVSHMQQRFLQVYALKERDLLKKFTADHAEQLAERNLTSFFQRTPPEPICTPEKEDWERISSFFLFNEEQTRYSILQAYVEADQTATATHGASDAVDRKETSF